MKKSFILISGPTGVGKTKLVESLAEQLQVQAGSPVDIVNGDMGQLYEPLSIGTAKPDWQDSPITHHLFDIIKEPRDCTVKEYRDRLVHTLEDVWQRGHIPILVGGSGFYLKSLFFPPTIALSTSCIPQVYQDLPNERLWHELNAIDPLRAQAIKLQDRYRLQRALTIWHETGEKPSGFAPMYQPIGNCLVIYLTRERADLYEHINERVITMIEAGWIDEVQSLGEAWSAFLHKKKLIGYPEIITFIKQGKNLDKLHELIDCIAVNTRRYAKRQVTFWRSLSEQLRKADPENVFLKDIVEINLTFPDHTLYINQLVQKLVSRSFQ